MPKQTQKIILWLVAAAILGGSSPLPALAETVQDFSSQYALKRVGAGKRGDDYPGRYLVYSQGDTTPPGFWERGKATLQGKQAVSTIHAEGELQLYLGAHKRYGHTATALGDGTVLIAGGVGDNGRVTHQAFLYIPKDTKEPAYSETFQAVDNMRLPRAFHSATLLPDGNVLLLGGEIATGSPIPFKWVWGIGLVHESTYTGEVFMTKRHEFIWLKDYFKETGVYDSADIRSGYLANMFVGRQGQQAVLIPGTSKVLILGGRAEAFWSSDPNDSSRDMEEHLKGGVPSYDWLKQERAGQDIEEPETKEVKVTAEADPGTISAGEQSTLAVKVSVPEPTGAGQLVIPRAYLTLTIQGGGRFLRLTNGTAVRSDLSNVEERDLTGRTRQVTATLYPSAPLFGLNSYTYNIGVAGDEDFEFHDAIGIDVKVRWQDQQAQTMAFVKRRGTSSSGSSSSSAGGSRDQDYTAPKLPEPDTNTNASASPDTLKGLQKLYQYARFSRLRLPGAYDDGQGGWLFSVTYDKERLYLPSINSDKDLIIKESPKHALRGSIGPTKFLGTIKEVIMKFIGNWQGSSGYLSTSYYLQEGEILDLDTGRFEPLPEPIATDSDLVMVPLTDGQVLLTGGVLTNVVIYDGFKDEFNFAGELRYPRAGIMPLVQYDTGGRPQKVYLVGGDGDPRTATSLNISDMLDWYFFNHYLNKEKSLSTSDIVAILGHKLDWWLFPRKQYSDTIKDFYTKNIAPFDVYNIVTGQVETVSVPTVTGPIYEDTRQALEKAGLGTGLSNEQVQNMVLKSQGLALVDRLTKIGLYSRAGVTLDTYSASASPFQENLVTATRWDKNQYILTSADNGTFIYDLDENTWEPLLTFKWTATTRDPRGPGDEKAGMIVSTIQVDGSGQPLSKAPGESTDYCEVPALSLQSMSPYTTATKLDDGILFVGGRGALYGTNNPIFWVGQAVDENGNPVDMPNYRQDIGTYAYFALLDIIDQIRNTPDSQLFPRLGLIGVAFGLSLVSGDFTKQLAESTKMQSEVRAYIDSFFGNTRNILMPYYDALYSAWKLTAVTDVKRGDKLYCSSGASSSGSTPLGQPAIPSNQQPGTNQEILSDKVAPLDFVNPDLYGNRVVITKSANMLPTDGSPLYIEAKLVDKDGQPLADAKPLSISVSGASRSGNDPSLNYIYATKDEYETNYKPIIDRIISTLKLDVGDDPTPLVTQGSPVHQQEGTYAIQGLMFFQMKPDGSYDAILNQPLTDGSAKYAIVYLGGRANRYESVSVLGGDVVPWSQTAVYYADQMSADARPKDVETLSRSAAPAASNQYGNGMLVISRDRMPSAVSQSVHVTVRPVTTAAKNAAKNNWGHLPVAELGLNMNPKSVRVTQNGQTVSPVRGGSDNLYNRAYFSLVWSGTADDPSIEFDITYLGGRVDRFISISINATYSSLSGGVIGQGTLIRMTKSLYFDDQDYFISTLPDIERKMLEEGKI
ncbi:TPA: hypothetical protein DHW58_00345 [Patescibacteria group bacterium]|uniref:Uncharacterized protein n=2 Tax=Bacteria division Kazan-3B-28 TaxID=1798534 RepID=A0A0G2A4I8_UNCK3|nr:MAG: hypothetical protein VE98_C0001G0465 [candidate division Kazan bacterium GW2011_GWA1_50_15]KKW25847.1 MAG: hypothetical protein VE99_C0001G0486 [candidate division Kazan bacterium GW2011_GWC1_52_13]KKW27139.1 MAG: hypothetical protein VF00_C0001G0074 [candidate division Kazan bacterium GW2011_GWB1_52_7]HCL47428.1 hypothetical protein [Patescibacteria group bacterium]